jgi:hypothetical protein
MDYATLTQVRAYLKLGAAETTDDALLQTFVTWANRTLDSFRRGDARYETRHYDYPLKAVEPFGYYDAETWVAQMNAAGLLSAGRLQLDDDLLALSSVVNGDGTEIPTTEILLEPANLYPKAVLKIKNGSAYRWLPADENREQCIAVSGWWGYHPQYLSAWTLADTVQNDPLTAIGTSLIVVSAANFQVGQLLRIEDELVTVTAVKVTVSGATIVNTLTVTRASNGTTAAAHVKDTGIYLYIPWGNYQLAGVRLAVWRYRQKDVNVFDQTISFETGVTIIPATIPADVRVLLPPRRFTTL